jgi:hypothetical protein
MVDECGDGKGDNVWMREGAPPCPSLNPTHHQDSDFKRRPEDTYS